MLSLIVLTPHHSQPYQQLSPNRIIWIILNLLNIIQ
jgi:hypothetical protein